MVYIPSKECSIILILNNTSFSNQDLDLATGLQSLTFFSLLTLFQLTCNWLATTFTTLTFFQLTFAIFPSLPHYLLTFYPLASTQSANMQFTLVALLAALAASVSVSSAPVATAVEDSTPALERRREGARDHLADLEGIPGNHLVVKKGKGFTINSNCAFSNDHISGDFHLFAFDCGGTLLRNGAQGGWENWAFSGNYDEIRDADGNLLGATFKD
jgi:hypothetical protein